MENPVSGTSQFDVESLPSSKGGGIMKKYPIKSGPFKKDPRPAPKSGERTSHSFKAPSARPQGEASHGKGNPDELKLCGYNACQKVYLTRAEDIVRVYLTENRLEEFSELVKSCVRRRKAYHILLTTWRRSLVVATMRVSASSQKGDCLPRGTSFFPSWKIRRMRPS